jgi:protein SCO1
MEKKESPIWVALIAVAIVVGALFLIKPSKTAGVMSDKFAFTPKTGEMLPVSVPLTDQDGKNVVFGDYLKEGRPVMFLPIFYKCNGVCYTELESLTKMLVKESTVSTKKTADSVVPGRDFDLVVVSVHPKETYELAGAQKAKMMEVFRMGFEKLTPEQQSQLETTLQKGLHFTVGEPDKVKKLTDAIGFQFTYDEAKDWVNHPAAAAYISTGGRIMGYNTGPSFATKTVRTSVASAQAGRTEPNGDVFLLGCFKMAAASKSTKIIVTILNIFAVVTVGAIGAAIYYWNKRFPSDTLSTGGPTA